jgi:hypothetical protein
MSNKNKQILFRVITIILAAIFILPIVVGVFLR